MSGDKRTQKSDKQTPKIKECNEVRQKGWSTKNQKLIRVSTLTALSILALASIVIMVGVILRRQDVPGLEQEEATTEETEVKEPTIHISSSLADTITVYDLVEEDGTTRMLTIPIQCELSANYYTTNKKMVNGTFPNESTEYDGFAENRFAKYGVANCRTELSIGYDLPDGFTIDADEANEGKESYLEQYPEENRFIIWRIWDIFADKTLAATGKSTGNKMITIYDESSSPVKRYGLTFVPILHDEDKEFLEAWEKQIVYGGSETLKPKSPKNYSDYYDNRSY